MKPAINEEPGRIAEWRDVDAATFRDEIVPRYRPAVLRGLVAHWPAVQHGKASVPSIGQYLRAFDKGTAVDFIIMLPHIEGRMFYTADMRGFNFSRSKAPIGEVSDKLVRYAKFDNRPSLVVQSALIADCLPGFPNENRLPILDESVPPRIWLGSAVTTPAHFDESNNVACVVSGKRRFTLFPPEQISNLYIGPLGHAPTATPISLVSLTNPDFARFPRFKDALAAAARRCTCAPFRIRARSGRSRARAEGVHGGATTAKSCSTGAPSESNGIPVKEQAGALTWEMPRPLFPLSRQSCGYTLTMSTSDGQRFLVLPARRRNKSQPLTVVINWQTGLAK